MLTLTVTQWGFKTDDFGNIYHTSLLSSWQDVSNLFFEKSIETLYYPSGTAIPPSSFFSGLYRPISFIYYLPQYLLFGINAYGYYITSIILHACCGGLLYVMLLRYVPYSLAISGAFLFGLHPSLHNWIGWISAQTYQSELFILLLQLILLRWYISTHKKNYLLCSLLCYALNLWLKEATIIFPLWLSVMSRYLFSASGHTKSNAVSTKIITLCSFWIITVMYLLNRALVMGLTPTENPGNLTFAWSWESFLTRQRTRFFDGVSYLSDSIGLCWLPSNNPMLKGSLILMIISLLAWLFYKNNEKKLIIILGVSGLMFSWPALLMHYQPRYLYLALPFFIGMGLVCIKPLSRWVTIPFLALFIAGNGIFLVKQIQKRSIVLQTITQAFSHLIQNPQTSKQPLYFVGLPHHWFAMSVAQAVWLLSGKHDYPIYHNATVIERLGFTAYLDSPHTTNNYLQITQTKDVLQLTSTDTEQLWIKLDESSTKHQAYRFTLPENIYQQQPLIITWDYCHDRFFIIDAVRKLVP